MIKFSIVKSNSFRHLIKLFVPSIIPLFISYLNEFSIYFKLSLSFKELDLCQVFRHVFWKYVILSYLNLFQFPFDKQKYFYLL